jgi:argininosuccinate synthase
MAAMSVQKKDNNKNQMEQLQEMLKEMFQTSFYGSVEVKFEAGRVTIVRKTESMKI